MDEVIELARKLAVALAKSPQARRLKEVQADLTKDSQLSKTLEDYRQQAARIAQLEHDSKPIEVEDKRQLQGLQETLVSNDLFKRYTSAQMEYVDMMRKVNQELHQHLADVEGPAEQA